MAEKVLNGCWVAKRGLPWNIILQHFAPPLIGLRPLQFWQQHICALPDVVEDEAGQGTDQDPPELVEGHNGHEGPSNDVGTGVDGHEDLSKIVWEGVIGLQESCIMRLRAEVPMTKAEVPVTKADLFEAPSQSL